MSRFEMFPTLTRELSNEKDMMDDIDENSGINMLFNGALVISGGGTGRTFTGGLGEGFYEEDSSSESDVEDSLPWDSIAEGHGVKLVSDPGMIKIEIFPAVVQDEGKDKKIMYPVMVMRTGGVDSEKALVYRRYSEFADLFKKIKKHKPELLTDFNFPSKVYGKKNHDSEVLENRRRSFEKLLKLIHSDSSVSRHEAFREFFYLPDLREACSMIKGGQYRDSLKLLLNALHLQVKLADSKGEIVATLCNIVDVEEAMGKIEDADRYAAAALQLLDDDIQSHYMIPLLDTCGRLREMLQKESKTLKRKLRKVESMSGIEVPNAHTLRELSVQRFKS